MKDIVISGRRILREVLIYAGCFVAALAVNVYSIVQFKTEWKELFTTLHITLAVALVFFGVLAVLRGIVFCGRLALRRKAG
jgi:TRAP-type C4-dicarboxylate transport system permease small subunit